MKNILICAILVLAVTSVGCGRHWRSAMRIAAVTAAVVGTAYILHHHNAHYPSHPVAKEHQTHVPNQPGQEHAEYFGP